MIDPNLQLLEDAATVLRPVLEEFVFVGGCATGLLVTDPAAGGVRPTTDVDVITEASSYGGYNALADRLRELGLTEDARDDAPICRWRYGRLTIDVMPSDGHVLGFSNQWYAPAMATAQSVVVGAVGPLSNRRIAVSPDGERFLLLREGDAEPDAQDGTPAQVIVVENWLEELKRLVPIP